MWNISQICPDVLSSFKFKMAMLLIFMLTCWKIHLCHDLPPLVPFQKTHVAFHQGRIASNGIFFVSDWRQAHASTNPNSQKLSWGHCLMPENLACSLGMNTKMTFGLVFVMLIFPRYPPFTKEISGYQERWFKIWKKDNSFEIWLS